MGNIRRPGAPAAAVLVAAVPVATWGLVGQQNAKGVEPSELDHAFQPPVLPMWLDIVLGAAGLLLAVTAAAVLARESRRGRFDRRWWEVIAPLVVAGLILGAGWRVLTAGVIGANIGAGFVVVVGVPLVVMLLLWSLARGLWLALAPPRPDDGGPGRRPRTSGVTTRSTWGSGA